MTISHKYHNYYKEVKFCMACVFGKMRTLKTDSQLGQKPVLFMDHSRNNSLTGKMHRQCWTVVSARLISAHYFALLALTPICTISLSH